NDVISTYSGADIIDPGAGNDTINGGDDVDTYIFGLGYGNDVITDIGDNNESVRFNAGVTLEDLTFTRNNGDDLIITLPDSSSLRIADYFITATNRIKTFHFEEDSSSADVLTAIDGNYSWHG